MIPFGSWAPDLPNLGNGATVAKNAIPAANSYIPFASFSSYSNALASRCFGSIAAVDSANVVYNYAGTNAKLYALGGTTWADVTRLVGGDYSLSATENWEFVLWGDKVIGTEITDVPQIITLGSVNFDALSGSPPKARHIGIVKNFVVLGNLDETGTLTPHAVRWSAINDETDWTISAATQADRQELRSDNTSAVQRIIGGEYGTIFTKETIWRMSYVGGSEVFQFDLVEPAKGAISPRSVVKVGRYVFYISQQGINVHVDGAQSIPIGQNKVDKFLFDDLDTDNFHRINSIADPSRHIVMWAYPGSGNTNGNPNKILLYNWKDEKFSLIEQDIELFGIHSAAGGASTFTMDNMDTTYPNIDTIPFSLDSLIFGGSVSKPLLGGFDTNHKLGFFDGSAMSATLETGEVQHFRGKRALVTSVRPIVDGNDCTATVGSRNRMQDAYAFGPSSTQNATGNCDARVDAFYHRYRVTTSGNFNHAIGVEVEAVSSGDR